MALGPGALSLLTQPTHIRNPARGTGMLEYTRQRDQRQKDAWYQQQREKEFEQQSDINERRFGLEEERFEYGKSETIRKEQAAAFDRLQEAIRSKNPDIVSAAVEDAARYGISVPGYQRPQGPVQEAPPQQEERPGPEAPKAAGEKPAKATAPWEPPPQGTEPEASAPAGKLTEEQARVVSRALEPSGEGAAELGEDGSYLPVVSDGKGGTVALRPEDFQDSPEEWAQLMALAQKEAPSPQKTASGVPPWLTNELEARGDISYGRAQENRQLADQMPQAPPPQAPSPQRAAPMPQTPPGVPMPQAQPAPMPQAPARMPAPPRAAPMPQLPPAMQGAPQQQPPTQGPGAPLPIVDSRTGRVIGTMDVAGATARARGRIAKAFGDLMQGGASDEERQAAEAAMRVAQSLVGTEDIGVQEAIDYGFDVYHRTLNRSTAETVARGGKEEGELTRFGAPSLGRTTDIGNLDVRVGSYVYDKIIKNLQGLEATKELVNVGNTMSQLTSSLDADFGFADRQSLRNILLLTEGKRQTDKDLEYALKGAGNIQNILNELEAWTPGGGFTDTFKGQLRNYANLLLAESMKRQANAERRARAAVQGDALLRRLPPEEQELWAQQAERMVSGSYKAPAPKTDREKKGPDAKKGGSADERAKKLMGDLDAR